MKLAINNRQAFKILDVMTTPEEKAQFLSTSKDDFALSQHFGLGLWIRNNWIYPEKELVYPCEDPDTISSRLLEAYYEHLKRKKDVFLVPRP